MYKVCVGTCREPPLLSDMQPLVKVSGERSQEGVGRPLGSTAPYPLHLGHRLCMMYPHGLLGQSFTCCSLFGWHILVYCTFMSWKAPFDG